MKLMSGKSLHAAWATGLIWLLIFVFFELMRPGLIATRFVFIWGWAVLFLALLFMPNSNEKIFGLDFLVAVLAGAILILMVSNWLVGLLVAGGVFVLLLLINQHE
jgi:hypothetical protein